MGGICQNTFRNNRNADYCSFFPIRAYVKRNNSESRCLWDNNTLHYRADNRTAYQKRCRNQRQILHSSQRQPIRHTPHCPEPEKAIGDARQMDSAVNYADDSGEELSETENKISKSDISAYLPARQVIAVENHPSSEKVYPEAVSGCC